MTLLVTGSNGFVGAAVCKRLCNEGALVRRAVRSSNSLEEDVGTVEVGDISSKTDWSVALENVQQVVHLAARIHEAHNKNTDELAEFRRLNVEGTENLARQAAAAGVKRFIYLSSIKVNGESTARGRPFTVNDTPAPEDFYGISKHEAEQRLRLIAEETGMEVVIIRPPLVYGVGVKGNFFSMMRWVNRGVPLPLGAVKNNRRSLVALDNLVGLIVTCLQHPGAANKTFLVSDGEDLSTVDLLRHIGISICKPVRLWPMPIALLQAVAKLFGKGNMVQRLLGNLQVDMSYTCETLSWKPPISVDEALRRAVQGLDK